MVTQNADVLAPGPVHLPGRTARWTTSNVDEGLPGILTPLTWSFYFPPVEEACRAAWHGLGAMTKRERPIPDDIDGRFFNPFAGHATTNVDLFGAMADRMPGGSAAAMEEQLFGSKAATPAAPGVKRRYPFVAVKAPGTLRRAMRSLSPLAGRTQRWWEDAVVHRSEPPGDADLARLREARNRFAEILNTHLILSMACQGMMERVADTATAAGLPGLERELIKSAEGTAEFELVADLDAYADGRLALDEFLARHGYHGPREGLLDAVVWREDPAAIEALAEAYRAGGVDVADMKRRGRAEHEDACRRLYAALGRTRSVPARTLVRFSARAPVWRETGRGTILRAVDVGRASARAYGQALAERGELDDPEDVFLFTIDELAAAAAGGRGAARRSPSSPSPLPPSSQPPLRDLVGGRRAENERYADIRLPHVWRGVPELHAAEAPSGQSTRIEGLGVSSGVGEGPVQVVLDQRSAELEPGAVLVCQITDPSWASLFPLASAVVTDVGSAMSHAAIVCRELGIPCVANTRDGTQRLTDGTQVRVDGSAGVVEVIG